MNYYNDFDKFAIKWLEQLIVSGLIPNGTTDQTSIVDVDYDDLDKYTQCHFFAGISGWSRALDLAGWPRDREVWTGSCPCQPFSVAGKMKGAKDERHLWPEFFRLIKKYKPGVVFGEQVASSEVVGTQLEASFVVAVQKGEYARANKLAKRLVKSKGFHYWRRWIDGVQSDLETEGYTFGYKVLGSHSVGSPNIRQRLWWVAYSMSTGRTQRRTESGEGSASLCCSDGRLADTECKSGARRGINERKRLLEKGGKGQFEATGLGCPSDRLADTESQHDRSGESGAGRRVEFADGCSGGQLENSTITGLEGHARYGDRKNKRLQRDSQNQGCSTTRTNPWDNSRFIQCKDGKQRRIPEPQSQFQSLVTGLSDILGTDWISDGFEDENQVQGFLEGYREILSDLISCFPLSGKIPGRVGLLRGAGNAINPWVAAKFIRAFMESVGMVNKTLDFMGPIE